MTQRSDRPLEFTDDRLVAGRRITGAAASDIDETPREPMEPAHRWAVAEGRAQFQRGEVATDEEIESASGKFGT